MPPPAPRDRLPLALLVAAGCALAWSGIAPHDRFTWILEVFPAIVALPLLVATRRRFPLTPLAYVLITLHAAILMVGGHYTYAEVPLRDWIRDALHLARNPYDRLGHLAHVEWAAAVTTGAADEAFLDTQGDRGIRRRTWPDRPDRQVHGGVRPRTSISRAHRLLTGSLDHLVNSHQPRESQRR